MIGYKGMDANMQCRGMQFEVGNSYHVDGVIEISDEEWREIPTFPKYEVSTAGRVRSGRGIIKQQVNRYGYKQVHITDADGNRKHPYVHRLVLEAFCGVSDLTVNHIDENKENNNLSNLEYLSSVENYEYSNSSRRKRVAKINIDTGEVIDAYQSIRDASSINHINRSRIQLCCKGTARSAGGYGWVLLAPDGFGYNGSNPNYVNTNGLGGSEYTLDAIGDVIIRLGKVLFEIPCEW